MSAVPSIVRIRGRIPAPLGIFHRDAEARRLADKIRAGDIAGCGRDPAQWNRVAWSDAIAYLLGNPRVMIPRIGRVSLKQQPAQVCAPQGDGGGGDRPVLSHCPSPEVVSANEYLARKAVQRDYRSGIPLTGQAADSPRAHIPRERT